MYMLCVMNTGVYTNTQPMSSCLTHMAVRAEQKEGHGSHGEENTAINQLNPSLLSLYAQIYPMGQEGEGKTLIYSSCVGSCDKSRQHKLSFPHLCSWFGVSAALSGAGLSPNPSLKKLLALSNKQKDTRKVYVAYSLWVPEQYSEY